MAKYGKSEPPPPAPQPKHTEEAKENWKEKSRGTDTKKKEKVMSSRISTLGKARSINKKCHSPQIK